VLETAYGLRRDATMEVNFAVLLQASGNGLT